MTDWTRNFRVGADEIERSFSPAVVRLVDGDDAEWSRVVQRQSTKLRKAARPPLLKRIFARQRSEQAVKQIYNRQWSPEAALSRLDLTAGTADPIVWRGRRYFANSLGTKRVHLLYLMRLIETLRPRRVLEIGSGTGQNLFILAARFPEIVFTGIELTEAGYRTAEAIREARTLPEALINFSPLPINDATAHRGVLLNQGSAAALPFSDRSFDLVYTVQALEQMESIRHQALSEVARVCAGNVAMFEPFAEWNQEQIRRDRIAARQFFSASIDDLAKYGLRSTVTTDDMPTKNNYGIGLVVAARV